MLSESPAIQTYFSQVGGYAKAVRKTFPTVRYHQIHEAWANPYTSAFLVNRTIAVPNYEYANRDRISCAKVLTYEDNKNFALVKNVAGGRTIARGIFMSGNGAFNYYHWLIEILSVAPLLERLPSHLQDMPLLLPPEADSIASYRDALDSTIGTRNERIFLTQTESWTKIQTLIFFDRICLTPFNYRDKSTPLSSDSHLSATAFDMYRMRLQNAIRPEVTIPDRIIFLDRPSDRRPYNRTEVLEVMRSFKAEIIDTASLSFKEQALLFSTASIIVGPSGAAWSNLLFCSPGTRAIFWTLSYHRNFTAFSNIATAVGASAQRLIGKSTTPATTSREAYEASYSIDPIELSQAIKVAMQQRNQD